MKIHSILTKLRKTMPVVVTISALSIASFSLTQTAHAGVDGWDAGNIITDTVFENKHTMGSGDIQSFLNSKVLGCDTWGTQPSEFGGGTRRQWAEARGYAPPYTCMRDYSQNGKSAAQIIYDAAQEFSINPQVLLVLLQKEQSLVTDTWPLSIQYRSATGYGCPDTAACDAEYYGFTNQVRWAARMFRAIMNNSPTWYTPYVLGNNFIRYSPDSSCGGSNVYIQNRATQALYNYTPYQPNQGALDAGWGTTHCGAYGNRNFYLYFTSWFGSTRKSPFVSLDEPRWMRISSAVQKRNPWTQQGAGDTLTTNTQLKFVDKIYVDGVWYLRTAFDSANQLTRGVAIANTTEIPFEALQEPRFMELSANARKLSPRSGINDSSGYIFPRGTSVKITSKMFVNGEWYYRTEFDEVNGIIRTFSAGKIRELSYRTLQTPRYMKLKNNTHRVEPARGTVDSTTLAASTELKFTSKILAGTRWYLRTEGDTSSNINLAIPQEDVTEIPYEAHDSSPKWYRLKAGAKKVHPTSGVLVQNSSNFTASTHVLISEKIKVNGQVYFRTKFDATNRYNRAIPMSDVEEIPFIPLESPRNMRLTAATQKINPKTGVTSGSTFAAGTVLNFTTKIAIDGKWYFRSASDTTNNLDVAIPSSVVEEIQ